jgi:DNA-binding transcriptional ArsR family regulator
MNSTLRSKAVELRTKDELSFGAIKERLGVSKSTLSYWLKDFPLSKKRVLELRRKGWTKGEASREKYRITMRQKKEKESIAFYTAQHKKILKLSDDAFFAAGLMIYLCEGDKRTSHRIVLANTDVRLINLFARWLAKYIDVHRKDLRAQLHLYEDMNIKEEEGYWKKKLGFKQSQFYKTSIRPLRESSYTYSESYRHGTCSLYALGVQKKTLLMMTIQAFLDIYTKK